MVKKKRLVCTVICSRLKNSIFILLNVQIVTKKIFVTSKEKLDKIFEDDDGRFDFITLNCSCGKILYYEPHFENYEKIPIYKNNLIVYGDYLKDYKSPNYAKKSNNITLHEYQSLIKDCKIYEIPNPDTKLNKREILNYIKEKLTSMNIYFK